MGENMEEVKLTVSQVAQEIGESVHTLRNWIRDFRPYLGLEKSEGGYNLFSQESLNVVKKIQAMYRDQNLSTRQIQAILAGAEKPTIRDEETSQIQAILDEQRDFNQKILDALAAQQKAFEEYVRKRDEQLMFVLREIHELKKESRRLPAPQRWYKRLFVWTHSD